MVSIKAKMHPAESDTNLIQRINQCEKAMREQFPEILWLFFEPDLKD